MLLIYSVHIYISVYICIVAIHNNSHLKYHSTETPKFRQVPITKHLMTVGRKTSLLKGRNCGTL